MDDGFSIMLQQTVPASILTRADCADAMVVCPECREEIHFVRASHDGKRRAHLSHAMDVREGEDQAAAESRREERDAQCTRRALSRKADEEAAERALSAGSAAGTRAKERVEPQRLATSLRNMMVKPFRETGNKAMVKLVNDILRHKEMSGMARMLLFSPEDSGNTINYMKAILAAIAQDKTPMGPDSPTPLAVAWRMQVATDILKAGEADASRTILVEMALAGMVFLAADVISDKDNIEFDLDGDPIDPRHRMGIAIISASQTSRHKAHRKLTRVLLPARTMPWAPPKPELEDLGDQEVDAEPISHLTRSCITALAMTEFEKHADEIRKLLGTRLA